MKNLPKKIYLQLGEFRDDADFLDTDFLELTGVTWADSDIDEYDQEYIHEDEVNKLRSLVQAQKEWIDLILSCNIKNGFISMSLYQANQRTKLIDKIKELENG